jgi:hypothetical protein
MTAQDCSAAKLTIGCRLLHTLFARCVSPLTALTIGSIMRKETPRDFSSLSSVKENRNRGTPRVHIFRKEKLMDKFHDEKAAQAAFSSG